MKNIYQEVKRNVKIKANNKRVAAYGRDKIEAVYEFCTSAQVLRTPENCVKYLGEKNFSIKMCRDIIQYLFDTRRMGAYCYCKGSPQSIMQEYILKKYSEIDSHSKIMEVGPGDLPLFSEEDYENWYSCDINYHDGVINFSGKIWGEGKYERIYNGGWENLSDVCKQNNIDMNFDLVCGSHSFEHNHKPITALKETASILKSGGLFIIFVPDGYSTWNGNYDATHSLYLVKDMVYDLFSATDDFIDISCDPFRKNMDLVITARKK